LKARLKMTLLFSGRRREVSTSTFYRRCATLDVWPSQITVELLDNAATAVLRESVFFRSAQYWMKFSRRSICDLRLRAFHDGTAA
jgi:hypothetical protein